MPFPATNRSQGIKRPARILANARVFAILAVCSAGISPDVGHADVQEECLHLEKFTLRSAVALSSTSVAAGSFKAPDGKAQPELGDFCRFAGSARPSSDSDIRFEVWMPLKGWNGRLWGIGGRNFAGEISYAGLGSRLSEGYAAVAFDSGHPSDTTMDSATSRS